MDNWDEFEPVDTQSTEPTSTPAEQTGDPWAEFRAITAGGQQEEFDIDPWTVPTGAAPEEISEYSPLNQQLETDENWQQRFHRDIVELNARKEGRARAEQTGVQKKDYGLLGESFGILTPSEQDEALAQHFAEYKQMSEKIADAEKMLARMEGQPRLKRLASSFAIAELRKHIDSLKHSLPDIKHLEAIRAGKAKPFEKTAVRSAIENVPAAFGEAVISVPQFVGIVKGYVTEGDVDDDSIVQWARNAKSYVRKKFPGDEARQNDFEQQLASGVGSLASFYGGGAVASIAKAGPKVMTLVISSMGAMVSGSGGFDEATQKLKEARAEAERAGKKPAVAEIDRIMQTLGYAALGTTEALPIGRTLGRAKGPVTAFGQRMRAVAEGAVEESVQEGGQQLGQNVTAQLTTDPERSLGEGVARAATIGGLLGGGVNLVLPHGKMTLAPEVEPSPGGVADEQSPGGETIIEKTVREAAAPISPTDIEQSPGGVAEGGGTVVDGTTQETAAPTPAGTEAAREEQAQPETGGIDEALLRESPRRVLLEKFDAFIELDKKLSSIPEDVAPPESLYNEYLDTIDSLVEEAGRTGLPGVIVGELQDLTIEDVRTAFELATPEDIREFLLGQKEETAQEVALPTPAETEPAEGEAAQPGMRGVDDELLRESPRRVLFERFNDFIALDEKLASLPDDISPPESRYNDYLDAIDALVEEAGRTGLPGVAVDELQDVTIEDVRTAFELATPEDIREFLLGQKEETAQEGVETPPAKPTLVQDQQTAPPALADQIKAAYQRLAKNPRDWVYLSELRPLITGATKAEVDNALKTMYRNRSISLTLDENKKSLTAEQREAAVRVGVNDLHLISYDEKAATPTTKPASEEAIEGLILDAVSKLQSGPGNFVRVDRLRESEQLNPWQSEQLRHLVDSAVISLADKRQLVLGEYGGPRPTNEEEKSYYVEDDEGHLFIGVAIPRTSAAQTAPAAPVAPTARNALLNRFAAIISGSLPRSRWARELGVSEEELSPLIDDAVERKWLTRTSSGKIRRGPRAGRKGDLSAMMVAPALSAPLPQEGDAALQGAAFGTEEQVTGEPNLEPAPMQATAGRIPDSLARAPQPGLESPQSSLADLIRDFNQILGVPVRQGRLDPGLQASARQSGAKVRGQTSRTTGVVRLAVMHEIDTLAHEGGHVLENRFGADLETIKRQHAGELTQLASPGRDALSEGFAEWFRRYVLNPQTATRSAPQFEQAFETFLQANAPDVMERLQPIRSGYQEWIRAPSAGVIAGSLSTMTRPSTMESVTREITEGGFRNTIQSWIDSAYTAVFDDLHPINQAVTGLLNIASNNLNIPLKSLGLKTANNPYKLLRLARDSYAAGHMDLLYGVHDYKNVTPNGPSFRQALAMAFGGESRGQWNDTIAVHFGTYLVNRRMVQEWTRYFNGELYLAPDKFTIADHQQSIQELERTYPQFSQAADQIHQFLQNMLRKKFEAGLIPQKLFTKLQSRQDYVPVLRDRSDVNADGKVDTLPAARRDKYSVINVFRGSQRDVINPLQSIVKDAYETAAIIARNDAVKALDALARAAGPAGGRFAERIPAHEMTATQVNLQEAITNAARETGVDEADLQVMLQAVDDKLGDNAIAQIWRAGEVSERGEPIIYLWENGKRIPIRLADGQFGHDMLHAVTTLGSEKTEWYINFLSLPSTILRTGVTASLDFIGANYLRDQVSAWVLTKGFVPFYDGARGIYDDLTMQDISRIYSRTGGLMGGANVASMHESRIKREALELRRRGIRFTINPFTRDFWRMTEFSESGTRLALMRRGMQRALDDGLTEWEAALEAAYTARDYIDFGRHGSRMLAVRRLIPFFNAALQGLDRTIRGMRGRIDNDLILRNAISPYIKSRTGQPLDVVERRNLQQAAQVWGYMVALGFVGLGLSLLYEDDEEYEEISDYMRATHWLFRVDGEWYRIPKPYELAFFSNLFERTFAYTVKKDPTAKERFLNDMYTTVVPPHSIPGLAVSAELATDYSFFTGRPIVGSVLKRLPPELQFNAYASEFGKFTGKHLGVSPAMIDHFITGFGASYGREALNASNALLPRLGRATGGALGLPTEHAAEASIHDYFMVRRFTKDVTRGSNSTRAFWDLMSYSGGTFTQAAAGYKHILEKARDAKAAQEFLDRLPDEERAYTLLQVGNSGRRSKYRKLHPLNRAQDIIAVASAIRKDINMHRLYSGKDSLEEKVALSPAEMRQASEILSDIQMREARNALIALGVEGWKQRKALDVTHLHKELAAAVPRVYDVFVGRLTKKKLPSYQDVVKQWPAARDRILAEGKDAIVFDLYQRDFMPTAFELRSQNSQKTGQNRLDTEPSGF